MALGCLNGIASSRAKTAREQEYFNPQFLQADQQLLHARGLSYDSQIVFHSQNLGNASAENRLMISDNDINHGDSRRGGK